MPPPRSKPEPARDRSMDKWVADLKRVSDAIWSKIYSQFGHRGSAAAERNADFERAYTPSCLFRQFSHHGLRIREPSLISTRSHASQKSNDEEFASIQVRWAVSHRTYASIEVFEQLDDAAVRTHLATFAVDGKKNGILSVILPGLDEDGSRAFELKHATTFQYETPLAGRSVFALHNLNLTSIFSATVTLKTKPRSAMGMSGSSYWPPKDRTLRPNEQCVVGPCTYRIDRHVSNPDGSLQFAATINEHIEYRDAKRQKSRATVCRGKSLCVIELETMEENCLEEFEKMTAPSSDEPPLIPNLVPDTITPENAEPENGTPLKDDDPQAERTARADPEVNYDPMSWLGTTTLEEIPVDAPSTTIATSLRDKIDWYESALCEPHLFQQEDEEDEEEERDRAATLWALVPARSNHYVPVCHQYKPGHRYAFKVGRDLRSVLFEDNRTPQEEETLCTSIRGHQKAYSLKLPDTNKGLYMTLYDLEKKEPVVSAYSFTLGGPRTDYVTSIRPRSASTAMFMINYVLSGWAYANQPATLLTCDQSGGGVGIFGRGFLVEVNQAKENKLKNSLMLLDKQFRDEFRPKYQRGHLNPNHLNTLHRKASLTTTGSPYKQSRRDLATFTFLNVIPQAGSCNVGAWSKDEQRIAEALLQVSAALSVAGNNQDVTVYFMTGTRLMLRGSVQKKTIWTEFCAPSVFGAFRIERTNDDACSFVPMDGVLPPAIALQACQEQYERLRPPDDVNHPQQAYRDIVSIAILSNKDPQSKVFVADTPPDTCSQNKDVSRCELEKETCKWDLETNICRQRHRCDDFVEAECDSQACTFHTGQCHPWFGNVPRTHGSVTLRILPDYGGGSRADRDLKALISSLKEMIKTKNDVDDIPISHRAKTRTSITQLFIGAAIMWMCSPTNLQTPATSSFVRMACEPLLVGDKSNKLCYPKLGMDVDPLCSAAAPKDILGVLKKDFIPDVMEKIKGKGINLIIRAVEYLTRLDEEDEDEDEDQNNKDNGEGIEDDEDNEDNEDDENDKDDEDDEDVDEDDDDDDYGDDDDSPPDVNMDKIASIRKQLATAKRRLATAKRRSAHPKVWTKRRTTAPRKALSQRSKVEQRTKRRRTTEDAGTQRSKVARVDTDSGLSSAVGSGNSADRLFSLMEPSLCSCILVLLEKVV
eukprot:Opistho-2@30867